MLVEQALATSQDGRDDERLDRAKRKNGLIPGCYDKWRSERWASLAGLGGIGWGDRSTKVDGGRKMYIYTHERGWGSSEPPQSFKVAGGGVGSDDAERARKARVADV